MVSEWYILDGREVRPAASYEEYFRWRDAQRGKHPRATFQVAAEEVNDVTVSTVFLGLDHGWGEGPPQVFETMTFDHRADPTCDQFCWRYTTLDEAEAGHKAVVVAIRTGSELPE